MVDFTDAKNYKVCHKKQYDVYVCKPPLNTCVVNKKKSHNAIAFFHTNCLELNYYVTAQQVVNWKSSGDPKFSQLCQLVQEGSATYVSAQKPFVVSGTAGELYTVSAQELASEFKFIINGNPADINQESFNKCLDKQGVMGWQLARSITEGKDYMACFVPLEFQTTVQLATGVANLNFRGTGHGKGDFIVCDILGGKPNMSTAHVVTGDIFASQFNNQGWSEYLKVDVYTNKTPKPEFDLAESSVKVEGRRVRAALDHYHCKDKVKTEMFGSSFILSCDSWDGRHLKVAPSGKGVTLFYVLGNAKLSTTKSNLILEDIGTKTEEQIMQAIDSSLYERANTFNAQVSRIFDWLQKEYTETRFTQDKVGRGVVIGSPKWGTKKYLSVVESLGQVKLYKVSDLTTNPARKVKITESSTTSLSDDELHKIIDKEFFGAVDELVPTYERILALVQNNCNVDGATFEGKQIERDRYAISCSSWGNSKYLILYAVFGQYHLYKTKDLELNSQGHKKLFEEDVRNVSDEEIVKKIKEEFFTGVQGVDINSSENSRNIQYMLTAVQKALHDRGGVIWELGMFNSEAHDRDAFVVAGHFNDKPFGIVLTGQAASAGNDSIKYLIRMHNVYSVYMMPFNGAVAKKFLQDPQCKGLDCASISDIKIRNWNGGRSYIYYLDSDRYMVETTDIFFGDKEAFDSGVDNVLRNVFKTPKDNSEDDSIFSSRIFALHYLFDLLMENICGLPAKTKTTVTYKSTYDDELSRVSYSNNFVGDNDQQININLDLRVLKDGSSHARLRAKTAGNTFDKDVELYYGTNYMLRSLDAITFLHNDSDEHKRTAAMLLFLLNMYGDFLFNLFQELRDELHLNPVRYFTDFMRKNPKFEEFDSDSKVTKASISGLLMITMVRIKEQSEEACEHFKEYISEDTIFGNSSAFLDNESNIIFLCCYVGKYGYMYIAFDMDTSKVIYISGLINKISYLNKSDIKAFVEKAKSKKQ